MIGMAIDPRHQPPQQARRAEQREHEDGDDHHDDQEVRAAAHVLLRVRVDPVGHQLVPVLVGGDRLVLGPVVLEHAVDVLRATDQPQIADEQRDPEHAFGDVDRDAVHVDLVLEPDEQAGGTEDEDPHERDHRDRERDADLPGGQLLLLLGRVVRGDHQRTDADLQRLAEHDHPTEERLAPDRLARRDRIDVVRLDVDGPFGSRTATAQWSCPRIMTPSTTAWPP